MIREVIWGGLVGRCANRLADKVLKQHLSPQASQALSRKNFHDREVSLKGGIRVAAGVAASGLALVGSKTAVIAGTVPAVTAASFGWLDDRATSAKDLEHKGFHGHFEALEDGQLTSGAWKVIGIGTGAALGALAVGRYRRTGLLMWLVDTALIAGSANLANLLDLRPGRALKVGTLCAVPLAAGTGPGAVLAGAVLANTVHALPADLDEREMLGDTGANALGAQLGTAATLGLPRSLKTALAAGIVGLNLASEKVSFSRVIAGQPFLNWLDRLGRRA